MLAHISSRELSDWAAFELVNGPVGTAYQDAALAQIIELLAGESDNRERYPAPGEWWQAVKNSSGDSGMSEDWSQL